METNICIHTSCIPPPLPMLGQVDVEVDGAAGDGEDVGHLADVVHPHRPGRHGTRSEEEYL